MAIAFVNSGTWGAAGAPTLPGSRTIGNVLVMTAGSTGTTGAVLAGGTGADAWVPIQHHSLGVGVVAAYHVITGSESWFAGGGTITFTTSNGTLAYSQIHQYSGVDTTAPIDSWIEVTGASSTTGPATAILSTNTDGTHLLLTTVFFANRGITTPPSGMTKVDGAANRGGHSFEGAGPASAGSTGAKQAVISSAAVQYVMLLALKAVGAGGPPPADLDAIVGGAEKDIAWSAMMGGAEKAPSGLHVMSGGTEHPQA